MGRNESCWTASAAQLQSTTLMAGFDKRLATRKKLPPMSFSSSCCCSSGGAWWCCRSSNKSPSYCVALLLLLLPTLALRRPSCRTLNNAWQLQQHAPAAPICCKHDNDDHYQHHHANLYPPLGAEPNDFWALHRLQSGCCCCCCPC